LFLSKVLTETTIHAESPRGQPAWGARKSHELTRIPLGVFSWNFVDRFYVAATARM
jgi:hypothetical protein